MKTLSRKVQVAAVCAHRRAAPQLPAVVEERVQPTATPQGPWSTSPSSLQHRSCCRRAAPPPPALLQTSQKVQCPTSRHRVPDQQWPSETACARLFYKYTGYSCSNYCLDAGCERTTPFLQAYEQRYVALEVYYLGWQYHGFASQTDTQATVEVLAPLVCSKTDR